jgi:hypothetical protein
MIMPATASSRHRSLSGNSPSTKPELFASKPANTVSVNDEMRCKGPGADCCAVAVRGDGMNRLLQYVSRVVDWAVTVTAIGLTLFLIVGTFALMLWNGDK